ncbi:MAG: hypothetical protein RJA58_527 [Pseudomonadota bacterium]|jgi:hypothetical protein
MKLLIIPTKCSVWRHTLQGPYLTILWALTAWILAHQPPIEQRPHIVFPQHVAPACEGAATGNPFPRPKADGELWAGCLLCGQ